MAGRRPHATMMTMCERSTLVLNLRVLDQRSTPRQRQMGNNMSLVRLEWRNPF